MAKIIKYDITKHTCIGPDGSILLCVPATELPNFPVIDMDMYSFLHANFGARIADECVDKMQDVILNTTAQVWAANNLFKDKLEGEYHDQF